MKTRESLPIGSVRPSGQNPRRDFGDIPALARTITATGGQPVYRYLFCHPRPAMRMAGKTAGLAGGVKDKTGEDKDETKATGAVHSADIEYAMGTLPTNRMYDWQPEDFTVSAVFQGYYLNFVKTGDPNGLGRWTKWCGESEKSKAPSGKVKG